MSKPKEILALEEELNIVFTEKTLEGLRWERYSGSKKVFSLDDTGSVTGNQIQDVSPLTNLTNLTWLGLWDNKIQDISFLASLVNCGRVIHLK